MQDLQQLISFLYRICTNTNWWMSTKFHHQAHAGYCLLSFKDFREHVIFVIGHLILQVNSVIQSIEHHNLLLFYLQVTTHYKHLDQANSFYGYSNVRIWHY